MMEVEGFLGMSKQLPNNPPPHLRVQAHRSVGVGGMFTDPLNPFFL